MKTLSTTEVNNWMRLARDTTFQTILIAWVDKETDTQTEKHRRCYG